MAKTLAQLRTHARVYLDEVSEADWTDAQIDRELNYAYMETYAAVVEVYEDYYRSKFKADFTEDQQEYQLPDDCWKVRRVEIKYNADDERVKAKMMSFDQISRATNSTSYGSIGAPVYDLTGPYLRILPVPDTSVDDAILLYYIRHEPEMDEDTDTINIPFADRYAKYIVKGAVAELLRKGQQEESVAAVYSQEFQESLEKMKQELETRYADGTKMILDTTGDFNDFGNMSVVTGIYR